MYGKRSGSWSTRPGSTTPDVILPVLTAGLEGLLSTSYELPTKQFVTRVPLLAQELGIAGVSRTFCGRMYEARSQGAHGGDIELFQSASRRPAALEMLALLQSVLRATVLRAITDASFRAVFEDDALIRNRWPVERRHRWWRRGRARI